MMKGLMDRCLSRKQWVDSLKERAETAETEVNKLMAGKETQVRKLAMTKKALEESKSLVGELRKVLQDKEGEISTLKEQVHRWEERVSQL